MKKTNFKTWLTACCCLIVVLSKAQTGNPYWNLPPSYWSIGTSTTTPLPQNNYTWTQSSSTVTPGYGYDANAILNFTATPQTVMTDADGFTLINGPSNMQMDENNNPLFSIVSGYIFNKNGYLIDTLVDTISINESGSSAKVRAVISGYTEVCVVPNPANCQQYYIFTAMPVSGATHDQNSSSIYGNHHGLWYNINANGCYGHNPYGNNVVIPYYTLLDVSQQGSYMPYGQYGKNLKPDAVGNATARNLYTVTSVTAPCGAGHTPFYGDIHYAATSVYGKGANAYRLLFVLNDAEVLTYSITGTGSDGGVHFVNSQTIGAGAGEYTNTFTNVSELELYQYNTYDQIQLFFGAPNGAVGNNTLIQSVYDTLGNYIPASTKSTYTYTGSGIFNIEGIEYSPDGSKLYVTHTSCTQYPSTVDEIILSTGSVVTVSSNTSYEHSQIEKGTDGNLYLIQDSTVLRQIINPNSTGTISTTTLSLGTSQRVYPANLEGYEDGVGTLVNSNIMPTNTLPDQIDQDTYSNILTGACCLFYQNYDKYTYVAGQANPSGWTSTTQTWRANTSTVTAKNPIALSTNTTNTITIGEELRIPAGYVVTIDSMTIEFSPQARLIIENGYSSIHGGKLILNACTLTVKSLCTTDMWPGIQVWGSPSQTQNSTNQGWLQTNSNCVIENAYVGVLAGYDTSWLSRPRTPIPPFTTVPSGDFTPLTSSGGQGGGIIECSNTKFLNNQRHVVFYSYNSSTSTSAIPRLYECTFKNTNLLTHTQHNHYYVGMYNYTPVNIFPIEGCAFADTVSVNYVDTGLYTLNSAYNVEQVVGGSPYVSTSFSNFGYGIFSHNSSGSATFSATNSNFLNNYYGIYAGAVNNIIVETDTFKIFTTTCSRCTKPNAYGLYIDNATGYSVRDNYFGRYSVLNTNNLYGIVANNTGAYNNFIFRNTFANLAVGNQAQYINYITGGTNPNSGGGLMYVCNTFNSSTIKNADIYVAGSLGTNVGIGTGSASYTAGINYEQGTNSATGQTPSGAGYPSTGGNQFSHTSGGYDFFIDLASNNTWNSNYEWCCGSGSAYDPLTVTSQVSTATTVTSNSVNCSDNPYTCSGCRTADPMQIMQSQADAFKASYDSMSSVIDGGSTTALLALVSNNNNSSQSVLNSLTQAAPYISDAVLKAYINSTYPTADITQVLNACSPLTSNVYNAVTASNLSSSIKSQLAASQNAPSKMGTFELKMNSVLTSRHLILNDLIRTYLRDTIQTNVQTGYALMKTEAMELPAKSQFETGLSLGDSVMAANALTQVAATEGQSNYVNLSTILLQNLSVPAAQLMKNTSVLSTVQTIAADSSDRLAYLKANILLSTVGKSNYIPYIQPFPQSNTQAQANERTTQVAQAPVVLSASTLNNQPNPFKESTIVNAVVVEKTQNAYIVITDMVGNELARYPVQQGENNINVNAGNLDQAMMFCTLIVDGVKIKTNKMVLIK